MEPAQRAAFLKHRTFGPPAEPVSENPLEHLAEIKRTRHEGKTA
jgi:hypothetical protein